MTTEEQVRRAFAAKSEQIPDIAGVLSGYRRRARRATALRRTAAAAASVAAVVALGAVLAPGDGAPRTLKSPTPHSSVWIPDGQVLDSSTAASDGFAEWTWASSPDGSGDTTTITMGDRGDLPGKTTPTDLDGVRAGLLRDGDTCSLLWRAESVQLIVEARLRTGDPCASARRTALSIRTVPPAPLIPDPLREKWHPADALRTRSVQLSRERCAASVGYEKRGGADIVAAVLTRTPPALSGEHTTIQGHPAVVSRTPRPMIAIDLQNGWTLVVSGGNATTVTRFAENLHVASLPACAP
ncbi:hypothetical protein [Actinocorallia longicatena]|uniref:LigA protein n=1 Tax=Actinocorallia longicatena TaxID=111803 RepID=A0ABP6QEU7_9ACTN